MKHPLTGISQSLLLLAGLLVILMAAGSSDQDTISLPAALLLTILGTLMAGLAAWWATRTSSATGHDPAARRSA